MKAILRLINRLLKPWGLTLTNTKNMLLVYQHDYGSGGYQQYRETQIFHNKRKIDRTWADKETLAYIVGYLQSTGHSVKRGLCHGTRRGFEQAEFTKLLGCPVIGTEISDTASEFPNTVHWDFHEQKPEWVGANSFVYTNSLDQAFEPRRALETWAEQLRPEGLLFIEHSMSHAAAGASEMDPFGAHPMVMPYLLLEWGRGKYRLEDILHPPHKKAGKFDLWIFVVSRTGSKAAGAAASSRLGETREVAPVL